MRRPRLDVKVMSYYLSAMVWSYAYCLRESFLPFIIGGFNSTTLIGECYRNEVIFEQGMATYVKRLVEGVQHRLEAKTIKHVSLRFPKFAGTKIPHLCTGFPREKVLLAARDLILGVILFNELIPPENIGRHAC